MIRNDMTSIRINWLRAYEAVHGRKVIVTRQELLQFHQSATATGPLGMPLNYPSWLTNPKPNKWKVGRATYKLPWDELEAWEALAQQPASTPQSSIADAAPDSNAPTLTVAEISNEVAVSAGN